MHKIKKKKLNFNSKNQKLKHVYKKIKLKVHINDNATCIKTQKNK